MGTLNARGSRQRDNQRSRLYAAEDVARTIHMGNGPHPAMTMAETRAALDTVLTSRWFKQRFRVFGLALTDGRGTRNAFADGMDRINMPRWARQHGMWVLLHELAHVVTPSKYAWHGPEFAKTYLALVEKFIGKDAGDLLRAGYQLHKVAYRTANVGLKPKFRVATQAQKKAYLKREEAQVLNAIDKDKAAKVLRAAAKAGIFGPSGHKERTYALAIARKLEVA